MIHVHIIVSIAYHGDRPVIYECNVLLEVHKWRSNLGQHLKFSFGTNHLSLHFRFAFSEMLMILKHSLAVLVKSLFTSRVSGSLGLNRRRAILCWTRGDTLQLFVVMKDVAWRLKYLLRTGECIACFRLLVSGEDHKSRRATRGVWYK